LYARSFRWGPRWSADRREPPVRDQHVCDSRSQRRLVGHLIYRPRRCRL